jgi:mono/diheme cytochrome c family protein
MQGFFGKILKVLKWTVTALGAIIVIVGVYVAATWDRTYDAPYPQITASQDPTVIAHGEYLVTGPAHCSACHLNGPADLTRYIAGEKMPLRGGWRFPIGPLGFVFSRNLTPDKATGIGRYTDAQVARVMRHSVLPDGRATIAPMMPYGNMSDDDVTAVISYLRAQAPVANPVPANEWGLLGKVVIALTPTLRPRLDVNPPAHSPAEAATKERGEYLARYVANCEGCHTPRDPMTYEATGPAFSGGFLMEPEGEGADKSMRFRTPNLTPESAGSFATFPDADAFVGRFRTTGRVFAGSPMPWESYRQITETDLRALYEFFRTLPSESGPKAGDIVVSEFQ